MSRSVYASQGSRTEQLFHEDLIVESLSFYAQNFYYIPRTLIGKDEILGEDRLSEFKEAYGIEMYLENVDGFEGAGAFIQKFGLMMEQSATLVVARRRWQQLIGRFGQTIIPARPTEGDLLYFPLTGGLFEIKFVQHQNPFYQLGNLYVFKLQVELFQYASERMSTGVKEIDAFETLKSFDVNVVKNGQIKSINITNKGVGYSVPPLVKLGDDWQPSTAVNVRDELCYGGRRYIVSVAGTTSTNPPTHTGYDILLETNGTAQLQYAGTRATATAYLGNGPSATEVTKILLDDAGSGYNIAPPVYITSANGQGYRASAVAVIENLDNQDSFGDNNKFREEAAGIVFNENNPFGDLI